MPAVVGKYGKCVAAIYVDISKGLFVVPVSLGVRAVGFPLLEVDQILKARVAGATEEELRELVNSLHQNRMAGTGKAFESTWQKRHQMLSELAKTRKKRKPKEKKALEDRTSKGQQTTDMVVGKEAI
jgi:prophage regulatory protein